MDTFDPSAILDLAKLALEAVKAGGAWSWLVSVLALSAFFVGAKIILKRFGGKK